MNSKHRLLPRVFKALSADDGYEPGLHRLSDELREEKPARFLRFYYEEILGRSPERPERAQERVDTPARPISEFLSSDEFMFRHDLTLQKEYAHLERALFLHVRKAGGTTLIEALRSDKRYCPICLFPGYDNGYFSDRLEYLRKTIIRLESPDARYVFTFGHPPASHIISNKLKRGWDSAFTVLRNPVDAGVSMLNFLLTKVCSSSNHPNNLAWREKLGFPPNEAVSEKAVDTLIPNIVRLLVDVNPMCSILGQEATMRSAIDTVAILDLKIIKFPQLDEYIKSIGIKQHRRMNVSKRYIELENIDRRTRLDLFDKLSEDIKFYAWVERHATAGDGPWVRI